MRGLSDVVQDLWKKSLPRHSGSVRKNLPALGMSPHAKAVLTSLDHPTPLIDLDLHRYPSYIVGF